jgi:hypothetical protein
VKENYCWYSNYIVHVIYPNKINECLIFSILHGYKYL